MCTYGLNLMVHLSKLPKYDSFSTRTRIFNQNWYQDINHVNMCKGYIYCVVIQSGFLSYRDNM